LKTLYLLRHSKSSWSSASLNDFDRPLNDRGKKDAPFMGEVLLKKNILPEIIISSPALRAISTAKIIAEKLNYPFKNIKKEERIYEASASDIMDVIYRIDKKIESIIIVGHNPGMTDLINKISNKRLDNLPTSGMVCLKNKTEYWNQLKYNWKFEFIEYPQKYKL